ncbi:MAG: replication associated protein [Wigfec virus K19_526]|nr:MAG: replication associated protein [Wigfec virus K19_526]
MDLEITDRPDQPTEYCEPPGVVVDTTKKFKINNQRLFLTYSQCEFERDDYFAWIKKEFSSYPNAQWYIAEETHEDGSPHRHVLINFGKAFQTTASRRFDFNGCHPNIARVGPTVDDWCKCCFYMCKEDKHESLKPLMVQAQNYSSVMRNESFNHYLFDNPNRNALDLKTRWSAAAGFNFKIDPVPKPSATWFCRARDYMKGRVNDYDKFRDIIWFSDCSGNSEKSLFAKWAFGNKDYCVISAVARVGDFMRAIVNACEDGWTSKYLVVSLPREWNDDGALYTCLEMAKDGIITTNKYDSKAFRIRDDVMIFVVANRRPTTTKMTLDRWHLYDIMANKQIRRIPCILNLQLAAGLNNVKGMPGLDMMPPAENVAEPSGRISVQCAPQASQQEWYDQLPVNMEVMKFF